MSATALAPIPPGELRRAVNAWARRGLRARWPLRLVVGGAVNHPSHPEKQTQLQGKL
jgi:hypothetical protein